jgi:phosphoribosylformylglycinamidine (FGAM) synthase-like enzyme
MGAAGLTCSAVEMGAKGGLGIELTSTTCRCAKTHDAYEMMLSESQERMLMVLRPEKEAEAKAIFDKWGLDFAIVGETTDDLRFVHQAPGREVANLPIKELGDEAPEYDRPWVEPRKRLPFWHRRAIAEPTTPSAADADGLARMSSRRWVWEQYDTLIQGNTAQRRAAMPASCASTARQGARLFLDVTPRYVRGRPVRRRQAGGRRSAGAT